MQKKAKSSSITVLLMIIATLISKLLGMLRGVCLASVYNISEEATAFSAASRIPLTFFDIVFASAILGCFIPVYNSFSKDDGKRKRDEFASVYLNFLLLLTSIFAILGIVFSKQIIEIVAPGLIESTKELAILLLRIMFPLIVLAAASYTFVGVLQSCGEFIVPAFISAVSNLLVIIYFLFLDKYFGIKGLSVAYLVAWFAQLITTLLPVKRKGFKYVALLNFKNEGFLSALKMTPLIIMGSWLAPVALLISMRFATLVDVLGAVPSFEYAVNLFTVITGVTTYGICNYLFPKLSSEANYDIDSFVETGRAGLSGALFMTIPISALAFALAPQGVSIIYERGTFDSNAVNNVSLILRSLTPGMIGFTLVEFLSRTFYALKKPFYCVVSVLLGIISNVLFALILISAFDGGLISIGITYSLAMLIAGISMLIIASVKIKKFFDFKFLINVFKLIISGIASAGIMFCINDVLSIRLFDSILVNNLFSAIFIAIIGLVLYVLILVVLREATLISFIKNKKG